MKTRTVLVLCFLFQLSLAFAQKEAYKWYFGTNAGLDFATSPPTVVTGAMGSFQGCSSIADSAGNLLFYTHGQTIWNASHVPMLNGTGLISFTNGVTQPALIVKKPGTSKKYYVFGQSASFQPSFGVRYSEVDMSLAGGQGSVTTKNALLYGGNCVGKLAGTMHCNGTDVWVMTHEDSTNNFRAYLVTSTGVNTTAVVSSIGGEGWWSYSGQMKFSPVGKNLAYCASYKTELFRFDNITGQVSNYLDLGGPAFSWGCAFSPDGSKLYASTNNALSQWDLCQTNDSLILNSKFSYVVPSGSSLAGMELGPDGKIYLAPIGGPSVTIISDPNWQGSAANVSFNSINMAPKSAMGGFPNFLSGLLISKPEPIIMATNRGLSCFQGTFITTTPACKARYESYNIVWNFGDPLSGAANTSTLSKAVHEFSAPGTYTVKLILNRACRTDTLYRVAEMSPCVGVHESTMKAGLLNVYPNPATEKLTIETKEDLRIFIYDQLGKLVLAKDLEKGTREINISAMCNGSYILKYNNDKKTGVIRFTKTGD